MLATANHFVRLLFLTLIIGSGVIAYLRLGYLPWLGVLFGVLGLALTLKIGNKQSVNAFFIMTMSLGLLWLASGYYVYYQWESGETVDIGLSDTVTIRTWVMDDDQQQVVIYESPPEHIDVINRANQVDVTRDAETYRAKFTAIPATDLSSAEYQRIFTLYTEKYAAQNLATDVYYLTIGPKRGSQLYVLYLLPQDT